MSIDRAIYYLFFAAPVTTAAERPGDRIFINF